MSDDLDLKCIGARHRLCLEDRPHRRDRDDDQDQQGNDGPRNLERGVAVHVLRLGLALARPEFHQRDDEHAFDEDEDRRAGPDQEPEQAVDVSIEVRSAMKN
jgi:hypothetical protein